VDQTGREISRKKRSTLGVQVDAIGIKFGDSGIVNMVPLTLGSTYNSGLRTVKHFGNSAVYELQVNVSGILYSFIMDKMPSTSCSC
jgi:hypothetical protein